nr:NAD(P)H-binding protein [Acidimicrobiia bacterium]
MEQILVTGATGYIGGRLVPELLAAGYRVRCLARTPAKLQDFPWRADVDVVPGDVTDAGSLTAAMEGCAAAYFLVHSMGGDERFAEHDRRAAEVFRDAAATAARLERIVYLGGLGADEDDLSDHLRSRHEVGRVLAAGPVRVTELRAAVVIGSGSASFEMLRNLVDHLPGMVCPRWVRNRCQPIAVRDVLHQLVAALRLPAAAPGVIEIGGPDVLTYEEMMQTFAAVAGLRRRLIVPVPLLSPRLSSLWIGLVTPLPAGLARPLVESLLNEVVVRGDEARRWLPHDAIDFRTALELALRRVEGFDVSTSWSSAGLPGRTPADPLPTDPDWAGGTLLADEREATTTASPAAVFATVAGIGGRRGWLVADPLWIARGGLD